ncbi:PapC/FimD family outer membrane usher protein [Aeromonas simiae]|uniref:PapC/FimD family outer membrane usher protein n=1 Tax=Aeromonas simiae TaxID=218936 RepID=A0A5J6WWA9_9GAMM|nr:PapC/FimD family outer membrane usher protein [Aeromonas simiae]
MRYWQLIAALVLAGSGIAKAVEFNTDILDSEDRENIDLSQFSQAGYIMPGHYSLTLKLNDRYLSEQEVIFREREQQGEPEVVVCLSKDQVELLGLRPEALALVTFDEDASCGDFSSLDGVTLRGDLSESELKVSIPQAWLEYRDPSWLPPSHWEEGVSGLLLDYNLNLSMTDQYRGNTNQNATVSGVAGANVGPWRLRADYQGNYAHSSGEAGRQDAFDWTRIYAYRALPELMAKLTMGEDYYSSNIFDAWRYTGAVLASDEQQLPPSLRGYAPEVSGIAKTNAKVIISQQGRVIYQTMVAAGPFRIQELNSAVNGQLDVRVEEEDGSLQEFQINTATVPYLTRPGQIRYKLAAGKPSDYQHHLNGPLFATGEMSWGISNAWSLYGGGILSEDYHSLALGVGRDLNALGTLSVDVTQAQANLTEQEKKRGRSYRLSYSKRFDEMDSEVTFAGYRFSERDYLSMSDFLSARENEGVFKNSKELYTVTASKSFPEQRISAYINWTHQTYWDTSASNQYSLSASKYLDIGSYHSISATLSAAQSEYNGRKENTFYLTASMPLGQGTLSYNGNFNGGSNSHSVSWYERLDEGDTYRLTAGESSDGGRVSSQFSGYYTRNGSMADVTASLSWSQEQYTSAGLSLNGGMTMTAEGAALHPSGSNGGTRMMITTEGVPDVPVGHNQVTNEQGVAVEPGYASYSLSSTSIDINRLPDNIEVEGSPVSEVILTEGAIGYRHFEILKGQKMLATLSREDGTPPPFGASVRNERQREVGMVGDAGVAWLSGINPGETLTLVWGSSGRCLTEVPDSSEQLEVALTCRAVQ